MANRVAGEIHKKGGILQQTFGETVANAYGLVFYQAADGKLYRAKADAEATVAGVLYLCADAATVKDTAGNALAQGRAEKIGWSWTVGKLVYVSPTVAGGLTQTRADRDAEDPAGRVRDEIQSDRLPAPVGHRGELHREHRRYCRNEGRHPRPERDRMGGRVRHHDRRTPARPRPPQPHPPHQGRVGQRP
jgi:hypothetical protein